MNSWITVTSKACPLFVPLVEEGWTEGEIPAQVARHYLRELCEADVDVLILGCTHYPLLRSVIQEAVGPHVQLIDSAEEVASSLAQLLEGEGLLRSRGAAGESRYFVTDSAENFSVVGARLLPDTLTHVTRIEI